MTKKNFTPPSAHDVARTAGVSQAAVSRAFNPGASISDGTRKKVLMAAKKLGYRPNLIARSLITGRSNIVGVVIGNTRNPFFLDSLGLLSARLSDRGKHLLVFTAQSEEAVDGCVEDLLNFRAESLLLMSASLSSGLARRCKDEGIPLVYFDQRARTPDGYPSVTGANFAGGEAIAQHLLDQGYRSPTFMAGSDQASTSREREAGFMACLVKQGLPPPERVIGHYERDGAMAAMRSLLTLDPRPDAVFCANDFMAMAAIEVARIEFGMQIGKEIGIAGFDDIEGARWLSFDLTTYSQPIEAMVTEVVEILFDKDKFEAAPHVVVQGELKIRNSTNRA